MKAKHVFLTMGLALVMGAGIAASGLISMAKDMKPARADATTIYCKMAQSWWKTDGAAVGIYAWYGTGEGATPKKAWPGERMTAVEGETDMWKFDLDLSTYTKFIFVRVNGSGAIADWGAKTADLEFPTDGKNLYTITSTSPVWGDPGCAGEWSVYTPVAHTYEMSVNGGTAIQLVQNGTSTEYCIPTPTAPKAFNAGDVLTFTKDSGAASLTPKAGSKFYSNNVELVGGDLKVTKSAATNIYWETSDDTLWVGGYDPADGAAYLVGSFNNWEGIKTVGETTDNVNYTFSGLELSAGAEFKMYKYVADGADDDAKHDWIQPTSVVSKYPTEYPATLENTNAKVTNAGTYDIHVDTSSGKYFIEPKTDLPTFTIKYHILPEQEMDVDESSLPDDVVNQHSYTLSNPAVLRTVKFFKTVGETTTEITNISTYSGNGNNIIGDPTNGYKIHNTGTNVKVYLKQLTDGDYQVYATGYSATGYSIDHISMTYDDDGFTPSGSIVEQYSIAAANYTTGQEIGADGTDNGGFAFPIAVDGGAGNNLYEDDGHIYVHNACQNQKLYLKMNTEGKFYLWLGGYEDNYILTVGSTDYVMHKNQDNASEYYVSGLTLTAGQDLSVKLESAAHAVTAKPIGNNNMTSGLKVYADATNASVYLDTEHDTLWAGGFGLENAVGFHMLVTGSTYTKFVKATVNPDNANEYITGTYSFQVGDKVQMVDCSHSDALPSAPFDAAINEWSAEAADFEIQDGSIICKTAVITKAYLQPSMEGNKIYFGNVSEDVQKAVAFAEAFVSDIETACSASEETRATTVKAAWDAKATAYSQLSAGSKAALQERHDSDSAEIRAFATKYEEIYAKRATAYNLSNFMEWNDIVPTNSINGINGLTVNRNVLVVTIIAVSTLAVSAGLVLFLLKRKRLVK